MGGSWYTYELLAFDHHIFGECMYVYHRERDSTSIQREERENGCIYPCWFVCCSDLWHALCTRYDWWLYVPMLSVSSRISQCMLYWAVVCVYDTYACMYATVLCHMDLRLLDVFILYSQYMIYVAMPIMCCDCGWCVLCLCMHHTYELVGGCWGLHSHTMWCMHHMSVSVVSHPWHVHMIHSGIG